MRHDNLAFIDTVICSKLSVQLFSSIFVLFVEYIRRERVKRTKCSMPKLFLEIRADLLSPNEIKAAERWPKDTPCGGSEDLIKSLGLDSDPKGSRIPIALIST